MTSTKLRTIDLAYMATFVALISACSWISIPSAVPFTMQTFAVFLTVNLLGGRRGTLTILGYILLGAAGAPVFAGFAGGLGILFGSTGGYLLGFLGTALLYWALVKHPVQNRIIEVIVLVAGLLVCYALGTVWFIVVYTGTTGPVSVGAALSWCVIPFVIPDLVKLGLAFVLGDRLRRHVHL